MAGIIDPGYNNQYAQTFAPARTRWIDWPIYFITTCTFKRRPILASTEVAKILSDEWEDAHNHHGWAIGRYVIMPDHAHFFCSADLDAKKLPAFMQA